MKVLQLRTNPAIYSSNVWLVLGEWNTIEDVNTVVDAGADPAVVEQLGTINTGVGKQAVAQVVLTHTHYDHIIGVSAFKNQFGSKILAHVEADGVDELLSNHDLIRMGDREFEVIPVAEHSTDSICLYCKKEKVLFSGDTPVDVLCQDAARGAAYLSALEYIAASGIETIYPGHGPVITDGAHMLAESIKNIRKSTLIFK